MALVELGQGRGRAKVVRELGDPRVASDVIDAMLEDRQVRRGFARRIEEEAAVAIGEADGLPVERRDLRDLPTFTVDPASAHDFDDAVSASRTKRGVRLWIHIADVAAHIRPGGALEKEAYRRANSTYVPGRVAPMLPHALSSEACSLAPEVDRLAVTAEIELSESGEPLSASFYRSRIRSDARLNYDQLDEIFAGKAKTPEPVAEPLVLAREAAASLAARRPRASLEVESFEPEFSFEGGQVAGAHSVPQTEAHKLIEYLMILTNERVAELLERRRIPTLYRVHEQPDPERIRWMIEQLAALDVPTPALPEAISPQQAGDLAGEASRLVAREAERRGHGREAYTSLVLRSLKQAHYADRNLGHAGLGSPAYAHFTSPIRRYPDLVAHRALLSAIGAGEEAPARRDLPRSVATARSANATRPGPSGTPIRCAPRSCSSGSYSSGVRGPLRGRGLRRRRGGRVRPIRWHPRRHLRGVPPGAPDRRAGAIRARRKRDHAARRARRGRDPARRSHDHHCRPGRRPAGAGRSAPGAGAARGECEGAPKGATRFTKRQAALRG